MKALICGSFDPVTNGHLDIIKRAAALFDSVTVGIFINSAKKYYFSVDERRRMLTEATSEIKNVTVDVNGGYVAAYVKENGIDVIIKGVRNSVDFEYEANMARINKQLYPGAETLFLTASSETETLSSTFVKEAFAKGDDVSAYVPESVARAFKEKKDI